jgi:hypothetical protein
VEHHHWEEAVVIFRTWTNVYQALKKQIITAVEAMYLEILNNDMVGFSNTTARDMIEHLFLSYGSITVVELEHNWENMRKSWDSRQPVESLFKQIQDFVDYAEAGRVTINEAQKLQNAYTKIFATRTFHSACRRWNQRIPAEQTWNDFKTQFAAAYRQHTQMQGETAAAYGYANAAVAQPADYDLVGAAIDTFVNLATATAVYRGIVGVKRSENK